MTGGSHRASQILNALAETFSVTPAGSASSSGQAESNTESGSGSVNSKFTVTAMCNDCKMSE